MNLTAEHLANIVTVLGFPISVYLLFREIKNSKKSLDKLTKEVKNQMKINAEKIENVNINNYGDKNDW